MGEQLAPARVFLPKLFSHSFEVIVLSAPEGDQFDFIIVGAGSAGCALAGQLAEAGIGTIAALEAGPTNRHPAVKVPFGLVHLMGHKTRDWRYSSTPQGGADGRRISIPRGRMVGGSGSLNSMVWFRGRCDDFDGWQVPGWQWPDVDADFERIEKTIRPSRLPDPHPLSEQLGRVFSSNDPHAAPSPERESAGVFHTNMRRGARLSAADAFLKPAMASGHVRLVTGATADRLIFSGRRCTGVHLTDGREITARRGVVLSAGSLASPAILMRSGIGPAQHLAGLGIEVLHDAPLVGENLHDHPAIGLFHHGPGSGYGLVAGQLPHWAIAPFNWLLRRKGRFASNSVEAGAFFHAGPDSDEAAGPDCQVHFLPFAMGYRGRRIIWGNGYYADVCVCRADSRGRLRLSSADPKEMPKINLGLLSDDRDTALLIAGFKRLRRLLAEADFGERCAPEVFPGPDVASDAAIEAYIRERVGTAYHPVGTLRMGDDEAAPVTPDLAVRGTKGLWVADASVMPNVTSANTNAPSMMIGHRGGAMIAEAAKDFTR